MMIDISRLRQSKFDAMADDSAWRAGINLWFSAWHSIPAASLENDDEDLAKAAGLGRDLRTWMRIREKALRGFVLCSDGRLYHETVAELALESWTEKLVQRLKSGAGNASRWKVEFDPAPLEAEISETCSLLAALNPQSKYLAKASRRQSQSSAPAIPQGKNADPTGNDNQSHGDAKTIPQGSQETGTGTGIYSVTDVTGAESAEPVVIDPAKLLFNSGIALLRDAGIAEARARPILGKWRQAHGDEAVIAALGRAKREGAIDPVSFIEASLRGTRNGNGNGAGGANGARGHRPDPSLDLYRAGIAGSDEDEDTGEDYGDGGGTWPPLPAGRAG